MKIKLIEIDTNGSEASKFTQNLELFDIITPWIVALINEYDRESTFDYYNIDWEATRPFFEPNNNGHCIKAKGGGYDSAGDFTHILLYVEDESTAETLSELCDELAIKYNINSWIEDRRNSANKNQTHE